MKFTMHYWKLSSRLLPKMYMAGTDTADMYKVSRYVNLSAMNTSARQKAGRAGHRLWPLTKFLPRLHRS